MKIVNTDDFDKATHWIPTDKDSTKFNVTIGKQYKLFYDACEEEHYIYDDAGNMSMAYLCVAGYLAKEED